MRPALVALALAGCSDEFVGSIEPWSDENMAADLPGLEGGWLGSENGDSCLLVSKDDKPSPATGNYQIRYFTLEGRELDQESGITTLNGQLFAPLAKGSEWYFLQILANDGGWGSVSVHVPVRLKLEPGGLAIDTLNLALLEAQRAEGRLKLDTWSRSGRPLILVGRTRKLQRWARKRLDDDTYWVAPLSEDGWFGDDAGPDKRDLWPQSSVCVSAWQAYREFKQQGS